MVNRLTTTTAQLLSLLFILLLPLWATVAKAELSASVDRTSLAQYETLELTLRTDSGSSAAPDLTLLENDFDILGTRQSRQIRMINGQTESWRDWVVTLSPKRTGRLLIPSLTLEGETSKAIRLEVADNANSNNAGSDNVSPVFIRTSVDNETVYVQQEVVLTLQIFYRVQLYDDRRLTPLNIDGAIVQQLGDTNNYETIVNGTRYGVFELKFSIHPQKTGAINIPSLTFSGTMADRRESIGSIFSMGGKPIAARSAEISLNVQPQPRSYSGSVWLPARGLTISDGWSGPTDSLKVGDAITRTIVVNANGLTSAQLPAIKIPQLSGINAYPDKSTSDDQATEEGIRGTRIEATAIIPTRPGTLTLPPIRYTWFDTVNNTEQVAEIPAKTIRVLPGDTTEVAAPVASIPPEAVTTESKDCPTVIEPKISSTEGNTTLWQIIAGSFALLWLLTTLAFWRHSRKYKDTTSDVSKSIQSTNSAFDEKAAFKKLEQACNSKNLPGIRQRFIHWTQAFYGDNKLVTAHQCQAKHTSDALNTLMAELESALFSTEENPFDSAALLKLLKQLRKQPGSHSQPDTGGTNNLYPS